jgi:hypothetical protein
VATQHEADRMNPAISLLFISGLLAKYAQILAYPLRPRETGGDYGCYILKCPAGRDALQQKFPAAGD